MMVLKQQTVNLNTVLGNFDHENAECMCLTLTVMNNFLHSSTVKKSYRNNSK